MTLELSLMAVSALVMVMLLVHKRMEALHGAKQIIREMREKTDPVLRNVHHTADRALSEINAKNLIMAANRAFVFMVRTVMQVSEKARSVSSGIVEKASKKKEDLTRSGAASFYLKQIKETKKEASADAEKM